MVIYDTHIATTYVFLFSFFVFGKCVRNVAVRNVLSVDLIGKKPSCLLTGHIKAHHYHNHKVNEIHPAFISVSQEMLQESL